MTVSASRIFMGVAFALALIATLSAAGAATGFAWALPGAIAAMALGFLV
jgi:hypothetical protein